MSFYHIIIELKDKDMNDCFKQVIERDRTDLNEIKEEVIKPYIQGKIFFVSGARLEYQNIHSLKITSTDKTASDTTTYANHNIANESLYSFTTDEAISGDDCAKDLTNSLFKDVNKTLIQDTNNEETLENKSANNKKVFLVHGHDELKKLEMSGFLANVGLKPIILHEQASGSRTIIEKIEANSDVGYAVILYTPCDVGGKKTCTPPQNFEPRARQNVIFEHGYFMGLLGRSRISALMMPGVEPPNDISGVVYINLDTEGGWKLELAQELAGAGYHIDQRSLLKHNWEP